MTRRTPRKAEGDLLPDDLKAAVAELERLANDRLAGCRSQARHSSRGQIGVPLEKLVADQIDDATVPHVRLRPLLTILAALPHTGEQSGDAPVAWRVRMRGPYIRPDRTVPGPWTLTQDGCFSDRYLEQYEVEPLYPRPAATQQPTGEGVFVPREMVRRMVQSADSGLPFMMTNEDMGALRAALSATRQPVWQPIETAPKDGSALLGCWTFPDRSPLFGVVSWGSAPEDDAWAGSEEGWLEGESCVAGLTHWMNLPPAPDAIEADIQDTKVESRDV